MAKRRGKGGLKEMRRGAGVDPQRGTMALAFYRLRTGLPDPDAWQVACPPLDGEVHVLRILKLLPVNHEGEWDFSVASSSAEY